MTEFAEKVRSLGFPRKMGQSEKVPVRNEDTGNFDGGYHLKHWDGRQDAHVVAAPVKGFAQAQEGND